MGAIASGGVRVVNEDVVRELGIPQRVLDIAAEEMVELLAGRRPIGMGATGGSCATRQLFLWMTDWRQGQPCGRPCAALSQMEPARLVVAVPVGAAQNLPNSVAPPTRSSVSRNRNHFDAVGSWYRDFGQTTDDEVRELLGLANGAGVLHSAS